MKTRLSYALHQFSEGEPANMPTEYLNGDESIWGRIRIIVKPQYQVRYHDKAGWEEISERELMRSLHKYYDQVTPAIHQMIEGETVLTPDAVYRLKNHRKV